MSSPLLHNVFSFFFPSISPLFHKDIVIAVTYNRDGSYDMQVSLVGSGLLLRAKSYLPHPEKGQLSSASL